ncbi:hypothetical protein ACP4OV_013554 [Aristida adscensionis]
MDSGAGKKTAKTIVCVTGAAGFVASWLVQCLLSRGHCIVHAIVHDPSNPKNAHLMTLDGAKERLRLFKSNMLDYSSVEAAVGRGVDCIFHLTSPAPLKNPINPDRRKAKVRRVVVVSSIAAAIDPKIPNDAIVNEDCYPDEDYPRNIVTWHYHSKKIVSQHEVSAYATMIGQDVVTVYLPWVLGPQLQPTMNTSSLRLIKYLKGEVTKEKMLNMVDVRDVVNALIVAWRTTGASKRYICSAHIMKVSEMVGIVRSLYPNLKLNYPNEFVEDERVASSKKLQMLGWSFRTVKETLKDTIESYKATGILD